MHILLLVMEALGLASGIIAIESLGVQISKRFSYFSDVSDVHHLIAQLKRTHQLLHKLPEKLQTLQGASTVAFGPVSGILAELEELYKELLSIVVTLDAEMRKSRLKKPFTVYQSRHRMTSISERLARLNSNFDLVIQSVLTLLGKVLSKTLIIAIRAQRVQETNRLRQEEYRQSAEQAIQQSLLIAPYTSRLSKRQKTFLGKITFSLGKNYYIHLQHPFAETPGSTDDSIEHHDHTASDSIPFREILDEEVEPLTSSAHNKDQLRLLFVFTPWRTLWAETF